MNNTKIQHGICLTFICAVVASTSSANEMMALEGTTDVMTTNDPRPPGWIDETYWRKFVNYTVGEECSLRLRGVAISTQYCVCFYICSYRTMEPWEIQRRIEIIRQLRLNSRKEIVQKNWHFIVPYSIISMIGGCGNILVLILVHKFMSRRSAVNAMISSLAIADTLVSLFNCPLEAHRSYNRRWNLGYAVCQLFQFLYFLNMAASILTLTVMSIERYLVIVYPMKAQRLISYGRARKVAVMVWIVAAILCIPTCLTVRHDGIAVCEMKPEMQTGYIMVYIAIVLFVVPTIIMATLYAKIGLTLYRSMELQKKMVNTSADDQKNESKVGETSSERLQVMKMLFAVVIVFILCWGPNLIIQAIYRMSYDPKAHYTFWTVESSKHLIRYLTILSYGNSALNPFLYFTSRQFRTALQTFLRWSHCCCGKYEKQGMKDGTSFMSQSTKQVSISTTK